MPYKDPEKRREADRRWYKKNKEKKKEAVKNYYEKNKEKVREYKKNYYEENKEEIIEYKKNYYEENKEKIREQDRKRNKTKKRKEYQLNRQKAAYHTDPCYKLRAITSVMVRVALKEGKGGESMLPYVDWNSYEELEQHLESQFEDWMTWENHGKWHPTEKRWHIDHIKPQSVLLKDVESMDDPKFRECWALENLQPLEAKENLSKGNKIIDE